MYDRIVRRTPRTDVHGSAGGSARPSTLPPVFAAFAVVEVLVDAVGRSM